MDLPDALAECRRAAREGYRIANDNLKRIKVDIDAVSADLKQSLASLETEEVWTPDVSDKNDPLAIWHEAFDPKPKKVQTPDVVKQLREQLQHVVSELYALYEKSYASLEEKRVQLDEFSIALFGRTMAGKSTLMEILTNGDGSSIGKGAQRTTRDVRGYIWRGLKVTDVPGVAAFEGADDEELAFKAAEQSDLVLFLITDDAPQSVEAECLARVRSLGKPVLGICNVKVALNDEDDVLLFFREKWLDLQRLGAIVEQFHEFANKYSPGSRIYFVYTHLRSIFLSQQPEYESHRGKLERASRFNLVERQIILEVVNRGRFLRWKSFVDGAVAPMLEFGDCLLDFSAENSSSGRVLIDKRRRVVSWANRFRSSGQERIDTFIVKQMNSLRNEISAFVEDNYEQSDAGYSWKRLIERQGVERKAKQLAEEIQEECKLELLDITREIEAELNLVGELSADRRISMDSIFDTKKAWNRAWNWGSAILVRGLMIIFTGGTAAAVVLIGRFFLSRWFEERGWIEDRESKARKQREKLAEQLQRDVDKIGRNLRRKLGDWFHQDLLKKQVYVLREELDAVTSAVLKLADTQRKSAWALNKEQKRLHRTLLHEALRQRGHEDSRNLISDIARVPGQAIMLLIEPKTTFPEDVRKDLEKLVGEKIWFVINTHNQASILTQAIGRGRDRRKVSRESKIRVAHVPIDNLDAVGICRIRLAQQLTELHIMR